MSGFSAFTGTSFKGRKAREAIAGYLFISPWLLGFIVFFAGPIVASFLLSFTNWDIVSPLLL